MRTRNLDWIMLDVASLVGRVSVDTCAPALLLICGGARGQACGMCSTFLSGSVLVCAGAQPYLGARIVSGDEMIDGVLSPRGLRPLGLWRPPSAGGRWRREHCGSWPQGIGLMIGERAVITSGGSLDELCSRRVGRGECVVAELAQDVVGAPAEFSRHREAGAIVVDPLGDLEVVGVVG